MLIKHKIILCTLFVIAALYAATAVSAAEKTPCKKKDETRECPTAVPTTGVDRSGKVRQGKASYYGREFYGKKMANGKPMNPRSNVAASKTLPLGTKAKVTNLDTGKSAVVDIQDRGPYVKDRIVDVSPKVAEELDIKEKGVAPVKVDPLVIPPKEVNNQANEQKN